MQIKTDNFEIEIHDSPDGYYVDVKTKSHTVTVFRTHAIVYENDKALVHVHTSMRKVEVAKEMEIDTTNEP
jgi:hypothetical protein